MVAVGRGWRSALPQSSCQEAQPRRHLWVDSRPWAPTEGRGEQTQLPPEVIGPPAASF